LVVQSVQTEHASATPATEVIQLAVTVLAQLGMETPATNTSLPGMTATPQEVATWLEPPTVQAMASDVGQTGWDMIEVSLVVVAMR
jgi:hypothetical protein